MKEERSQHRKDIKQYAIRSKQEKTYCLLLTTYCLLLTAYFLLCGKTAFASECQWIETTGEASAENITPDEARQLALNKARMKAVEGVSGARVEAFTLVKDYSLLADFIKTLSSGYVIGEKDIEWDSKTHQERKDSPPLTIYIVKLKICVAPTKIGGDPYFKVKGKLNRPVFIAGEEARITATCTKDCYLTIINLTADDKAIVLLPNEYEPSPFIKAGETYSFPRKGLGLEMYPMEGHKKNAEAFILIATKEKFYPLLSPFNKGGKGGGVLSSNNDISKEELYKALLSIPADSRAEEMLVYEVREK